jgi:hypothetical protein
LVSRITSGSRRTRAIGSRRPLVSDSLLCSERDLLRFSKELHCYQLHHVDIQIVAHVGPQAATSALAFRQPRNRRVVGMDALGCEHVSADRLDERQQRCRCGTDPIGKRRDIKLDTLPCVSRALAGERQVQAVFVSADT